MILWKQPNDPTIPAQQIWKYLFPNDPWPSEWTVRWLYYLHKANGLCDWHLKRIELCYVVSKNQKRCIQTLIHEFVHMKYGSNLPHGSNFNEIEKDLLNRLFGEKLATVYDRLNALQEA